MEAGSCSCQLPASAREQMTLLEPALLISRLAPQPAPPEIIFQLGVIPTQLGLVLPKSLLTMKEAVPPGITRLVLSLWRQTEK